MLMPNNNANHNSGEGMKYSNATEVYRSKLSISKTFGTRKQCILDGF